MEDRCNCDVCTSNIPIPTLKHISECENQNYKFWTGEAKSSLAGWFANRNETQGVYVQYSNACRDAFLNHMKSRRERKYLTNSTGAKAPSLKVGHDMNDLRCLACGFIFSGLKIKMLPKAELIKCHCGRSYHYASEIGKPEEVEKA
jgi:hypothetical protein